MTLFLNDKFEIRKLEEKIFLLRPLEGAELEVEDGMEMRRIFLEMSDGESFAVLLDASSHFNISPEARALLASKEFTAKRFAAALVTRSLSNKLVGNFFIKVNRPATPTKMFTDFEKALRWLREMKFKI